MGRKMSNTSNEEKTNEKEEKEEKGETKEEEKKLSHEEELEQQVKELKEQLLRTLADQENTRRIAKRDVESARQYAITSFAKSLLETADNLSRAISSVPEDLSNQDSKALKSTLGTLYEGIQMTETGLMKAFEKNGLT